MNQNSGMNRGPGSSYNSMNYNQQTTAAIAKELLDTGIPSLFLYFFGKTVFKRVEQRIFLCNSQMELLMGAAFILELLHIQQEMENKL